MRFYQASKNLGVLYTMSDTEPIQAPKKTKTPRSEEQLQVLSEARKKAYAVRAENKALRDQEKQMEKDIKEQAKQERMAKVKAHQQTKKAEVLVEEEYEDESSEEEEIVVKKRPKAKPKPRKKKKTRIVYETDSDEELVEEPTRRTPVPTPLTPQQIFYKKMYTQMF